VVFRYWYASQLVPDLFRRLWSFRARKDGLAFAPRAFPVLGTEKQARPGFVYASWFAQDLAGRFDLVSPDRGGWDARHVETALFTLGSANGGIAQLGTSVSADPIVTTFERRLRGLRGEIVNLKARTLCSSAGGHTRGH
jgi:hypothetical protein